jgi:hypothetical protein
LKLIGERGEVAPFFSLSSFRGVVDVDADVDVDVDAVARDEGEDEDEDEVVVLDEEVVAEVESLGPERTKSTGALCERECVLGFSPASVRERFAVFLSGSFFNRFAAVSGVLLFFIAGNEASLPCALREPFSFSDLTDLRPDELLVSLESSGGSSGNT